MSRINRSRRIKHQAGQHSRLSRDRWELSPRLQGGPPGRPRRRLGAHASAPAGAPATAAPTPVGWRERRSTFGPRPLEKFRARGGLDKGTLAMAHIGL